MPIERMEERKHNKKLHTKHIKIFRRNEIIYHFPCGRVATDPFLNRFACMLYFPWHFNKQIFYTIHTHTPMTQKDRGVCVCSQKNDDDDQEEEWCKMILFTVDKQVNVQFAVVRRFIYFVSDDSGGQFPICIVYCSLFA